MPTDVRGSGSQGRALPLGPTDVCGSGSQGWALPLGPTDVVVDAQLAVTARATSAQRGTMPSAGAPPWPEK